MRRIAFALVALSCALAPAAHAGPLRLYPLHAVPDAHRGGRIADSQGRQVLLRGVNVNSLVDYARPTPFAPSFPLEAKDPARMAAIGWNVVRLGVSWSRLEPQPGAYDAHYMEFIASTIEALRLRGIYAIIDLHQDAWGSSVAARPREACASGQQPNIGFDGAPAWATLNGDAAHCFAKAPELSPAVLGAWRSFFTDAPGPDGVGIQTRYLFVLYKLAERFAHSPSVAGYDVLNEPDTLTAPGTKSLSDFYAKALAEIRLAERAQKGSSHIVLFQPSVLWRFGIRGAPTAFRRDDNVAYAPHTFGTGDEPVGTAVNESKVFGGAPVVAGEWGAPPSATDGTYLVTAQEAQDRHRVGAVLSTWRQSCGDPAKMSDWLARKVPDVWGPFAVDCRTNRVTGVRNKTVLQLTRAYVRAAPGRLDGQAYGDASGAFAAWGSASRADGRLVAFYPRAKHGGVRYAVKGLLGARLNRTPGGGVLITARPAGGAWSMAAAPGGATPPRRPAAG